ncbi:MAG: riboflavin synthase [Chitinophagaceae bacterium]
MFTGIVETVGKVVSVSENGNNKTFQIESSLSKEFKIDQSVSHSGVCLTVESVAGNTHQVTAIRETLEKTNLGSWKEGSLVNIERCLPMNGRLDGHLVQGHVDTTAFCSSVTDQGGSWLYRFGFPKKFAFLVIEKGSISLNGISLTIFDLGLDAFSVAIIPYTFKHTNMCELKKGDLVNIEFDMVGKYINRRKEVIAEMLNIDVEGERMS